MALGFEVGPWRDTWATPSLVPSFPIAPVGPGRRGFHFQPAGSCRSLLSAPLPTSGTWTFASVVPKKGGSIWNNSRHPGFRAPMLEFVIIKRGRSWYWRLRDQNGTTIMGGREKTRPAARYHACRALFLLIATGWKATDLQRS